MCWYLHRSTHVLVHTFRTTDTFGNRLRKLGEVGSESPEASSNQRHVWLLLLLLGHHLCLEGLDVHVHQPIRHGHHALRVDLTEFAQNSIDPSSNCSHTQVHVYIDVANISHELKILLSVQCLRNTIKLYRELCILHPHYLSRHTW